MGQSMTSNGLVAHPTAQLAAAVVDGDQDETPEEWAADKEQDYDWSAGFYPRRHLFVPGLGPRMERRYRVQRLSGPGFDLVSYAPSDAVIQIPIKAVVTAPCPTGPNIPRLVLMTEEGEQFSLWDPVWYDCDFYRGGFYYSCLETEDHKTEALEEERRRSLAVGVQRPGDVVGRFGEAGGDSSMHRKRVLATLV
jgi:hypothetical protein